MLPPEPCKQVFSAVARSWLEDGDATGEEEFDGVVIVGGGICGLATALALHIKGIDSLVLERAESLRATGGGISLRANAWRVLEQLKVSVELRKLAVPIAGMDIRSIYHDTVIIPQRSEFRCVRRGDLVETLAKHLPEGCIRFGCEVEAISLDPVTRYPILSTSNGSTIRAKVLIGCDGSNSLVAKFLGLKPVRFLPLWTARGLSTMPQGHDIGNNFLQVVGKDISTQLIPIDGKTIYFSVAMSRLPKECTNNRPDPVLIRQVALQAMQGIPEDILNVVRSCDIESLSLAQLCYRAPWNMIFQPFQEGTVTVAGDAMHTMGPFIGQGGSAGLEDALVVARCLAQMASGDDHGPARYIEEVLRTYVNQRMGRILKLSMEAFLRGELITGSSKLKKLFVKVALKVLFRGSTNHQDDYDCGSL
ncbi:unnamed protein product [Alopecurus aequalis]